MKVHKLLQLLVLAPLFWMGSCGPLTDSNPCDCAIAQEFSGVPLTLGQQGPGIVNIAQSFKLSSAKTITKISLYVSNFNNNPTPLRVTLYADNGLETAPDTNIVIGTSVNTTVSSSALDWVNFCFGSDCTTTTVSLSADTRYWISVSRPSVNTVSAGTYYFIGADVQSYSNGRVKVMNENAIGTWSDTNQIGTNLQNYDLAFRIGCESTDESCE